MSEELGVRSSPEAGLAAPRAAVQLAVARVQMLAAEA